jgi:hypothetical protein
MPVYKTLFPQPADPKTGRTLAAFKSAAASAPSNVPPTFPPQGGSFEVQETEATPTTSSGDITACRTGTTAMFAIGVMVVMVAFCAF